MANYSYIDSKFVKHASYQGNAFRSTPPHSGTLWGYHRLPIKSLEIGGGLVFADRRFSDDANSFSVPGYIDRRVRSLARRTQ